jgi:hypothetical protein
MEFRWVAIITLWTMLAGPVFFKVAMPPAPQASGLSPTPAVRTQTQFDQAPQQEASYRSTWK